MQASGYSHPPSVSPAPSRKYKNINVKTWDNSKATICNGKKARGHWMPSSSWDAADGRTVMLLPLVGLGSNARDVGGTGQGCSSVGNQGPTWAPGLTVILSHAKAQMAQDWCSQLLCFITDGKKKSEILNMHFIFQLEFNILQNGNSLSLSSCSLEEGSFEEMH